MRNTIGRKRGGEGSVHRLLQNIQVIELVMASNKIK
jgi:hypothetical protein